MLPHPRTVWLWRPDIERRAEGSRSGATGTTRSSFNWGISCWSSVTSAGHGLLQGVDADDPDCAMPCVAHLFDSFGPSESIAKSSSFIATQEPEAFATLICVEIDPTSGEGIWASAGHPAPTPPQPPRGVCSFAREAGAADRVCRFPVVQPACRILIALKAGDRLAMFTDGLFERRGVDLEIGLTHLMITVEQTRGMDVAAAC